MKFNEKKSLLLITGALIISAAVIAGSGFISAQEQSSAETLCSGDPDCMKLKYKAADEELNMVYKEIRSVLGKAAHSDLRSDSLDWIRMKEYNCGWQKEMAAEDDKDFIYYECLYSFTADRTAYLRSAFGGKDTDSADTGTFRDGAGGTVIIRKGKDGDTEFSISVIRGPTFHLGEVTGALRIRNGKGTFDSAEKGTPGDEDRCLLDFSVSFTETASGKRPAWRITEDGRCSYFHGARAYFDGLYRKVSNNNDFPESEVN